MIKGLAGSSPPLPLPVQDSKDWESKSQGNEFNKLMDSKNGAAKEVVKAQEPEKAQRVTEKKSSREEAEPKTQNPPESKAKVMDPKTSAQRQRAIRKFMDSFEGEFGVPPEKMVDAMAQLTAQDLERPPEKTAEAVIAELELDPQDELKAKSMYMGLITQLNQMDVKADLPKSTEGLLSQLSAERLQLSGEKKQFMADQVQNLNDKFFMKGLPKDQVVQMGSDPKVMELLKKVIDPNQMKPESLTPELMQKLQMALEAKPKAVADSTDQILAQLKKQIEQSQGGEEVDLEALNLEKVSFAPNAMPMEKAMTKQGMQNPEQGFAQAQNQSQELQSLLATMEPKAAEEFKSSLEKLGLAVEEIKTGEKETVDLKSLQLGDLSSLRPKGEVDMMGVAVGKIENAPIVTEQNKTENMQQIMNQAQTLLKKGGGEVNVEMRPEGLGEIKMKLQVLDGKVQLHMNTESTEAKKMIESSLQDLKQSLAAHQLSMEHVKVDVVAQSADASKAQNDLQNQMQNFFEQQQRNGTKQFWQQFNENFGNRQARENYFDAQNIRTGVRRQELPGISEASATKGARRTGSSGRSLNLVA